MSLVGVALNSNQEEKNALKIQNYAQGRQCILMGM